MALVHVNAGFIGNNGGALLGDAGADAVNVEVHIDVVDDGLVVAVLHDEVLIEEADGLAGGCGGEADQERVEVEEHLRPQLVDGAMAFIHDDEVEELRGNGSIVNDIRGFALPWFGCIESGALLVARIEPGLPLKHGIETLDGGDDDFCGGVYGVCFKPLNCVEGGKFPSIIRRCEIGELIFSLPGEVAAVHQEENAFGLGEFEQAVRGVYRCEGLAGSRGHLDESAWIASRGIFEAANGLALHFPQPVSSRQGMSKRRPRR